MFLSRWAPQILSILRIITAALFFAHGSAKVFGYPPVDMFADLKIASFYGIVGILEIIAITCVALGSLMVIFMLFICAIDPCSPVVMPSATPPNSRGSGFARA